VTFRTSSHTSSNVVLEDSHTWDKPPRVCACSRSIGRIDREEREEDEERDEIEDNGFEDVLRPRNCSLGTWTFPMGTAKPIYRDGNLWTVIHEENKRRMTKGRIGIFHTFIAISSERTEIGKLDMSLLPWGQLLI
jgi:hypothetical protein